MKTGRLEAFSDGVIAILITIMVLELRVPHGSSLATLRPLAPALLSYVVSFVYLAIYWNNHHHLLQAAQYADGRILWANSHLLFWLSLVPSATAWIGDSDFAPTPVAVYGGVLICAGVAYYILTLTLIARHGKDSPIGHAIGSDFKGKISIAIYAAAVPIAFVNAGIAFAIYALVAAMWLVPDRRIERELAAPRS